MAVIGFLPQEEGEIGGKQCSIATAYCVTHQSLRGPSPPQVSSFGAAFFSAGGRLQFLLPPAWLVGGQL